VADILGYLSLVNLESWCSAVAVSMAVAIFIGQRKSIRRIKAQQTARALLRDDDPRWGETNFQGSSINSRGAGLFGINLYHAQLHGIYSHQRQLLGVGPLKPPLTGLAVQELKKRRREEERRIRAMYGNRMNQ